MNIDRKRSRMEESKMDANIQVIGVDNGNSQHKTRHTCFTTGIALVEGCPIVYDNILEYNGKCYKTGGDRIKVQDDKVCNENFYLLTLASIARELNARGGDSSKKNHIVLAVGLPIGRYGAEKKAFRNYLLKNRMVRFRYEKKEFVIFIEDVLVYPQCYGAIVDRLPEMSGQEIVVDIGSWTIDIMKVIDRVPDQATIATDPNGIITCMRRIQEVCVAQTNEKIDEYMIREFITKGDVRLDQEFIDIMVKELTGYTKGIFRKLAERGINIRTTPITFVGGGAVLMKRYAGIDQKNVSYVEDVKANAIGYETLASLYLSAQRKKEA